VKYLDEMVIEVVLKRPLLSAITDGL